MSQVRLGIDYGVAHAGGRVIAHPDVLRVGLQGDVAGERAALGDGVGAEGREGVRVPEDEDVVEVLGDDDARVLALHCRLWPEEEEKGKGIANEEADDVGPDDGVVGVGAEGGAQDDGGPAGLVVRPL